MAKEDKKGRMEKADRIVSPIFTILTFISILPVIFILFNTTANVITRAFFSFSIFGSVQLSQVTLALCVMCAMPVVTMYNTHIKVDLVVTRFSEKVQDGFEVFNLLFCGVVMVLLCYYSIVKTIKIFAQGTCTDALSIPYWPIYGLIGIMFGIAALCALYNIVHLLVCGETCSPTTFSDIKAKIKAEKAARKAG